MSPDIFMSLHDLLVSTYGLTSTINVSSIESMAMFLWMVGGPQAFAQDEDKFTRSLWIVHTKLHEVLNYLHKLAKDNMNQGTLLSVLSMKGSKRTVSGLILKALLEL